MKIKDYYILERDETLTVDDRKLVFRAYASAVLNIINEMRLSPDSPFLWRRASNDDLLPEPFMPAWRSMTGDDLMALYDCLLRVRQSGDE